MTPAIHTEAPSPEPAKLIYWALELQILTPPQAMACCLALGESESSPNPRALEQFLLEKGWLTQEQLHDLLVSFEQSHHEPGLQDADQRSVLVTIQQTMTEIDAEWLESASDYEIVDSLGGLEPVRSIESMAAFNADGSLSLPGVQISPGSTTASIGSPMVVAGGAAGGPLEEQLASQDSAEDFPQTLEPPASMVNMAAWDPASIQGQRYLLGEELGRGGLGIVVAARDVRLGRKVARKSLLRDNGAGPEEVDAFIAEARVTGQLEHPNIMPVYDFGRADDGDLFYTMRLMPSNNLEQANARGETSVFQFVKILQQVCMGLEYAHSRGVVHRDIKPANILLGQFGEVLILDWGIAKVLTSENSPHVGANEKNTKKLRGTPAYMAPELIQEGRVSPAIDQYALGVMLYEFLTGKLPFFTENLYTLLFKICSEVPIPPQLRAPERHIPEELSQMCVQMLSKRPEDRFPSCRAVHDQLEEFLEGSREKKRRKEAAVERIREAAQIAQEYHLCRALEVDLFKTWDEANQELEPWDPIEKKRVVWEKENEYIELRERAVSLFGAALKKYTQALEHEPGNADARSGLAELYWSKFEEAERAQDQLGQIQYRDLVTYYGDAEYARLLEGTGSLQIFTNPSGAHVEVWKYQERDRQLVAEPTEMSGESAFATPLPMGSYLLKIKKEGFREVRLPLLMKRCQELTATINLYTDEEIGEDFVYVPGGIFSFGGDPDAVMGLPAEDIYLEDFFIGRHPVTFAEYITFLNAQREVDPALAEALVPHTPGEDAYALWTDERGYVLNRESLFTGPIVERYPPGEGHEERLPALAVSWLDALRYCRWRSAKEGRKIGLPTEQQWEKAAKGADRRIYPWGQHFDAHFCKMGRSRPAEELQPEPIGAFPIDQSPYGMCDVIGSIAEWSQSLAPETCEHIDTDPDGPIVFRGGGWIASNLNSMRICSRVNRFAGRRSYNVGFRLISFPRKGLHHES